MAATSTARRLSPQETQTAFRTLLSALANPGRILQMPVVAPGPPSTILPLVLADFTSTVAILGEDAPAVQTWLAAVTGAAIVPPALADQVVVLDPEAASSALIEDLRKGSALAPEEGARLAIAVSRLGSGPVRLRLRGPGVRGSLDLSVEGCSWSVFESLRRATTKFPTGVDTWLFSPEGLVAALPRSTSIVPEGG